MTSDEPLAVVALPEGEQGLAQLLDRAEVLHPEELFFKGTDEALSAAVPLWFPHEGRAAGNPQEAQLGLEVVAHELAAMIMPQGQPGGELFAVGPEVGLDALPQGFQSFEAGAAARRMNAYALRSVVVHGDEDGGGAFVGPAGGRISPPHGIGALGNDGAVVRLGAMGLAHPGRGEEPRRPHQPQHPALAGANPGQPEARPHLAVPFADAGRPAQHVLDLRGQLGIGPRRLGPPLLRRCRLRLPRPHSIERGARHAQRLAGAPTSIPAPGGGRERLAHGLDLRDAKGWPASARSARSRSSSFSMVSSPILARSRARSSSRASVARLRTPAWPAARNRSRHCASVAAVTPSSRLSASRASPRRMRSTTSVFRREDQRPRSVGAAGCERERFMDTSLPGHHAPKPVSKKTGDRRTGTVAIFGPNRLFLNYISAVLPQLGEHDALHTTFEDWFGQWSGERSVHFTSRDEELEQMLDSSRSYDERAVAFHRARLKGSLAMGQVIQQRAEILRKELLSRLLARPLPIYSGTDVAEPTRRVLDVSTMRSIIQRLPDAPLNIQGQWLRSQLWSAAESAFSGTAERDEPRDDARASRLREARSRLETELDRRWPHIRFVDLYRQLLNDEGVLHRAARGLLKRDQLRLLNEPAGDAARAPNRWLATDEPPPFPLEDVAPLAYTCLVLNGPARGPAGPRTFQHVVVDEAQDLAPLQFVVLRAHTRQMTILGDIAQGIHSYRGIKAWEELIPVFDDETIVRAELRHSYRSTQQIVEFANLVLEKLSLSGTRPAVPFPRQGEPALLFACRDEAHEAAVVARAIRRYLAEQVGRVAVVCKTIAHAQQVATQLRAAGVNRLAVLRSRNSGYSTDVVVVPAYLAKGMEFEAAIVVGASAQQ